jgi:hypothetical protein
MDQAVRSPLLKAMPMLDDINIIVRQRGDQFHGVHIFRTDATADRRNADTAMGSGKGKEKIAPSRSASKSPSLHPVTPRSRQRMMSLWRGGEEEEAVPSAQCWFWFKTNFQTKHDLIRSKTGFILIKNFQIKYEVVGNQTRNHFIHRNFSRFKMDFKLKFRESKVWFSL